LIRVRSETPMDQQEIERVVDLGSVAISIEIDKMIEALPRGTNLIEVASDLVARLLEISDHREFAEILRAGLVARQTLIELGIEV
jgi:hypothetical protein